MDLRKPITVIAICFVLLFGPIILRQLMLGSAAVVHLKPTVALAGPVSQSLAGSNTPNTMPVYGKDFTLQNTKYFDDKLWVVTSIKPLNNSLNTSFIVLQKVAGDYRVVLGPGSVFSDTIVSNLPTDVVNYLKSERLVYVSTE